MHAEGEEAGIRKFNKCFKDGAEEIHRLHLSSAHHLHPLDPLFPHLSTSSIVLPSPNRAPRKISHTWEHLRNFCSLCLLRFFFLSFLLCGRRNIKATTPYEIQFTFLNSKSRKFSSQTRHKARDRISRRLLNRKRAEQEKSNKIFFFFGNKVLRRYMRVIRFWQRSRRGASERAEEGGRERVWEGEGEMVSE